MNYQAFTNESLTMKYEIIRGALRRCVITGYTDKKVRLPVKR